jgi:glutathione synthase/RimK-type ligase-like ATP-grasp enzyme
MILCIGSVADDTFRHSLLCLRKYGLQCDIIDLAQFIYSGELHVLLRDIDNSVLSLHNKTYMINSYQGILIRLIDISEGTPNEQLKRKAAGFYQALRQLFSNISLRVVNPPRRDDSNFSKLYHATLLASITGWQIPRSCLTNKVERALEFIDSCPAGAIFKGASSVKTWATSYDPELHKARLPLLHNCPVLFQERIEGPDVRVHIVGEQLFAELIESSQLDYRVSRTNKFSTLQVPDDIARGCIAIARDCQTPFLGIDFKIQQNSGIWFFLEANSMPCYQGYDQRAGGAISRALAEWLTHPHNA